MPRHPSEGETKPTLFIDRCAWSRKLGAALTEAGIPHVPHQDLFAQDTPDEV
jgi:hypothetical protein